MSVPISEASAGSTAEQNVLYLCVASLHYIIMVVLKMGLHEELLEETGSSKRTSPSLIWKHVVFAEEESGLYSFLVFSRFFPYFGRNISATFLCCSHIR